MCNFANAKVHLKSIFSLIPMKKILLVVAALLVGTSLSAQLLYGNSPANKNSVSDLEKNIQKLVMASFMIDKFYVDSVDSKKLTEDAINGILSKLDPHSAYATESMSATSLAAILTRGLLLRS